ncbi:MAG: HAMP domain-containing histidine kinase [Clostridiales bacterium]|nr:HAMP domain-containing histidine kinase [Clostridiales bacterium]
MFRYNAEVRREYLTCIVLTLILAASLSLIGPEASIAVLLTAVVFMLIRIIADIRRYRRISDLSDSIDKILHGAEDVKFEEYKEGEVAILSSEIHKMVIRLREQASQLLADKRFLSDSIADIAHQLRTPLTSMNIIVDMFSDAELSDEKRFDLLAEMMQSLNRIEWLINTLLKMSKIDADTVFFETKEYNVKEMLKKSAESLAVPLDINGVALKMEVPDDAVVRGDMMWTCEAISNILKNCMEHTPEGGMIEIFVKHTPIYTEIVIRDTGTGIDPEDIPHVFERFYRGKVALNTSIGIGLALSKMIVERQSGTIRADNREEPEHGAQFTIRFYTTKR